MAHLIDSLRDRFPSFSRFSRSHAPVQILSDSQPSSDEEDTTSNNQKQTSSIETPQHHKVKMNRPRASASSSNPSGPAGAGGGGQPPSRHVNVLGRHANYCNNVVTTAKYNFATFLPRFLFEQFRRYANIFFLFVALMQQIPNVSPTGRYTTAVPLICILIVSAIKEIFEDVKRHRADRKINNTKTQALNRINNKWDAKRWRDLVVGDVIKVVNGQFFPADLLLVSSSEPNGMCYIETSNLDGETNLKVRQSRRETCDLVTGDQLATQLALASIECGAPDHHLHEFHGNLHLGISGANGANGVSTSEPYSSSPVAGYSSDVHSTSPILPETSPPLHLGPDQVLLRGARLQNTKWIYGILLYAGVETKLIMNSTLEAPLKRSQVDHITNRQILNLFAILIVISLISAIAEKLWPSERHWYLKAPAENKEEGDISRNVVMTFLTFVILYNNLIPISLQVTLEIVRFIQAQFINADMEMYDEESDTPALARTSNLNEELGQVGYILSDKTGTLTRNVMEFKRCSIAGQMFDDTNFDVLLRTIRENRSPSQAAYYREFMTLLAVCHTVVPEKVNNDKNGRGRTQDIISDRPQDLNSIQPAEDCEIIYQASSPDEAALVRAAQRLGFECIGRTPQSVIINALGKVESYEILNVLEFTSDRKRMSVVVRCPDGQIKLYTKGADSIVCSRLAPNSPDSTPPPFQSTLTVSEHGNMKIFGKDFLESTQEHLVRFARTGLRTLCCAYKIIPKDEYDAWNGRYLGAMTHLGTNREREQNKCMDELESGLNLLGATAIEDKLQEGVPEAIDTLLRAGIRMWVLTGDKQETAINIGHACRLMRLNTPLIVINENSLDATRVALDKSNPTSETALVIDGLSLRYALSSELRTKFCESALLCRVVVCCRVSPKQKAEIVQMVKNSTSQVTLAIGDGANDVAMIRRAHVGVGISGHEGLQAVHSADYAISQFRFLVRLLLVHGSWSLSRVCRLILFSFYKNIALYVIELWFATVCAWSGQTIFERWTIGMYNVLFTALPPLVIGLFDRQCSAQTMLKHPKLYSIGREAQFGNFQFWTWIGAAILHSLVLFWLTTAMVKHDIIWSSGLGDGGYLVLGNMMYTYTVIAVCLKAGLEINTWTVLTHLGIWGSIAMWFAFLVIYSRLWSFLPIGPDMYGIDELVFSSPVFWLAIPMIPLATLSVDIFWKILQRTVYKTEADKIIESEVLASSGSEQNLLTETMSYVRNVFGSSRRSTATPAGSETEAAERSRARKARLAAEMELRHGYAFSQEEFGAVRQADVIRAYDTTHSDSQSHGQAATLRTSRSGSQRQTFLTVPGSTTNTTSKK